MAIREVLLAALVERFGDRGLCVGTPPDTIAVFPAKHPEVGDVSVRDSGIATNFNAIVAVGEVIESHFVNYDSHLESSERAERLTKDVVRFLQELFADRLLFWRSTDGRRARRLRRGGNGIWQVDSRPITNVKVPSNTPCSLRAARAHRANLNEIGSAAA